MSSMSEICVEEVKYRKNGHGENVGDKNQFLVQVKCLWFAKLF